MMSIRKKIGTLCFPDIWRGLWVSLRYMAGFGAARKKKNAASFVSRKPVPVPRRCVGCRLCVSICPTQAIEVHTKSHDENGRDMALNLNEDRCIACGLCTEACPENALDFKGIKEYVRR